MLLHPVILLLFRTIYRKALLKKMKEKKPHVLGEYMSVYKTKKNSMTKSLCILFYFCWRRKTTINWLSTDIYWFERSVKLVSSENSSCLYLHWQQILKEVVWKWRMRHFPDPIPLHDEHLLQTTHHVYTCWENGKKENKLSFLWIHVKWNISVRKLNVIAIVPRKKCLKSLKCIWNHIFNTHTRIETFNIFS